MKQAEEKPFCSPPGGAGQILGQSDTLAQREKGTSVLCVRGKHPSRCEPLPRAYLQESTGPCTQGHSQEQPLAPP